MLQLIVLTDQLLVSALSDLQGDITAEVIVLKDQFLVLLYWVSAWVPGGCG